MEITILKTSKPDRCAAHVEEEMISPYHTLSNVKTRMKELQITVVINVNGMEEAREINRLVESMTMPTLMPKICVAPVEEAKIDLRGSGVQILIRRASFNLSLIILRYVLSSQRLSLGLLLLS